MARLHAFLVLCVSCASAFPAAGPDLGNEAKKRQLAEEYLKRLYNLDTGENDGAQFRVKSASPFSQKLQQMQDFFGLEVTGRLDAPTMDIIGKPRCGNPDVSNYEISESRSKWETTQLTYRILNFTPDMPQAAVEKVIQKAFQVWSNVSPLKFTRLHDGTSDIEISFVAGDHGDNSPFDGPGEFLAHAFDPGYGVGGDVHFDEDETWSKGSEETNLFLIAAHEIGHALGLAHSKDPGALMFPFVVNINTNEFQLSQDDINGIQSLYGLSVKPVQPTGPTTPSGCDANLVFDAITTLRGEVLFFKDRFCWRKLEQSTHTELRVIKSFWPSLPSEIEAAYENTDMDQVRLFKGSKYWALSAYEILPGYPKNIHKLGFPQTVKQIDAATYNEDTRKTYFFVGDQYWSYDERTQKMDKGFPRLTGDDFPGISQNINAVFQKDGFFYFFSGSVQQEFSMKSKRITRVLQSNSWLSCGEK
ncbi:matrix metalloproteinase-18-like [Ailuropoda melanoleuca]|uniref:matrix metalloproteinase-18-like n=1 Tax=Ailuropoda melanoleuca TaxID=9646 RepID=UPI001493E01D|nr:matrix metalloproteinase-18-like [Ailuropoda melanoleuca]